MCVSEYIHVCIDIYTPPSHTLPQTRFKSSERLVKIATEISALVCCQVVCYTSENRELVRPRIHVLSSCLFP